MTQDRTNTPLDMSAQLVAEGFGQARDYFKNPTPDERREHARDVLKALSIYSRIRATQANEAAIAVTVAKMMNLEGRALAPIWEQITGRKLPDARERAGGDGAQQAA